MTSFSEISCAQLFKKIGTPDVPTIIDMRSAEDYARDAALIPLARRVSHQTRLNTPQETPRVKSRYKSVNPFVAKTVAVCQQGHKIAHGAMALLRTRGVPAKVSSGGFCA